MTDSLPQSPSDRLPLLLVPLLALLALPLMGNVSTWATLTVAGLAMGMIVFLVASGLTLVFGLMDVLNFGHGVFVSLGAFVGVSVLLPLKDWTGADSLALNLAAVSAAALVAMAVSGALGVVFERMVVRPVYGQHLKQILVTMGGMIVAEQLIHAFWGPDALPLPRPETLRGAFVLGDLAIEKFRLLAVVLGLSVFAAMTLLLNRSRLGLLIRAAVSDREMVESLGYRVKYLFVGVFAAGSALAGLGGLLLAPVLFPGARAINVAAKICVFVVLAASYDLLLGYTGIVSFAHTLFFGMGAYGVAIASTRWGPDFASIALGTAIALCASAAIALLIGLFSLRVRAIFFAMITLAVASACMVLASQLSELTGGEDGLSFKVPEVFSPAYRLLEEPVFGVNLDGKLLAYYFVLSAAVGLFLALLRIVNSPFGRVLQAIRENDFRAEALGYRTVVYKSLASCLAAVFATLAGALLALWLRYNGPGTTLSFDIMLDVLLMVVIGGMGTLYGAVPGAALLVIAQSYLQDLLRIAHRAVDTVPLANGLLHPDRWLLWLGVLFVLSVYFFPTGIVGRLRERHSRENS